MIDLLRTQDRRTRRENDDRADVLREDTPCFDPEPGNHEHAEVIESAGGKVWQVGKSPNIPGYSLHETGTLRMGNDPKKFITNKYGQTHDVSNLFVCDASLFLGCSDKTTTLSILAFSLRASEYLIESLKTGHV